MGPCGCAHSAWCLVERARAVRVVFTTEGTVIDNRVQIGVKYARHSGAFMTKLSSELGTGTPALWMMEAQALLHYGVQ